MTSIDNAFKENETLKTRNKNVNKLLMRPTHSRQETEIQPKLRELENNMDLLRPDHKNDIYNNFTEINEKPLIDTISEDTNYETPIIYVDENNEVVNIEEEQELEEQELEEQVNEQQNEQKKIKKSRFKYIRLLLFLLLSLVVIIVIKYVKRRFSKS